MHDTETAVLSLDVPSSAIEGGGALTGTVTLSAPPAQPVRVSLASGETGDVLVPATVEVPAGQTSAPFVITVVDDGRIDGTVQVTITAHVENWTDATAIIVIADNETSTLSVTLPNNLREGDPARGRHGQPARHPAHEPRRVAGQLGHQRGDSAGFGDDLRRTNFRSVFHHSGGRHAAGRQPTGDHHGVRGGLP